jgi:hypothetical protein
MTSTSPIPELFGVRVELNLSRTFTAPRPSTPPEAVNHVQRWLLHEHTTCQQNSEYLLLSGINMGVPLNTIYAFPGFTSQCLDRLRTI